MNKKKVSKAHEMIKHNKQTHEKVNENDKSNE